jgi:hypothetical protein
MCKRLRVHGWDDHSGHFAACFQDSVCHGAHQAGPAAAIDQAETSFSEDNAHRPRGRNKVRMNRIGRPAKDTNCFHKSILFDDFNDCISVVNKL